MQRQLLQHPSILNQLIAVCGLGLLLGLTSIWLPPYFALVGIAGVIYLIIAWYWPEIALLSILLLTSTIFDIYALPSIPIGVGHIIISDILVFALIGIIFLRGMVKSASYFIHTPLDAPLLAFYGTAILATAIGMFNSRITFNQILGEVRIVNFYLIFFIVTNLVRNEKQLRRLYGGIIFLAIFVAIAMIAQYVIGNAIEIIFARVETLDTAGSASYGVTRVLPPGQSLVMLGFICLAVQMLFNKKPSRFAIYLIQLGIIGFGVLLTFNRNFWAAIALALCLVGLLVSLRDKIKYTQTAFWIVLIGAFVLTPFRAVKGGQVDELIKSVTVRMSSLFNSDTAQESSLRYRYVENEYAFKQIASYPLIGLGLGANYRPTDRRIDFGWYQGSGYIHNGHLYVMLKTGLIGYLFFMWLLLLFVKRGFQNWKRIRDPLSKGIVLSFTTAIVGIFVATIFNPIFMASFWTPVIGVMLGISEIVIRMNQDRTGYSLTPEDVNRNKLGDNFE